MLAAAPRALLMQIAHPLVAEGVEHHSRFREAPRERLEGTLKSYMTIVYGTEAQAAAELRRLNRLHEKVRGPVEDPAAAALGHSSYAARDPELSLWVHSTLIDSTLVAYDAWIEPLARERAARFYTETRPIGLAFGIPDSLLPADLDAFDAYMARMLAPDGPIHVTPTARSQAETILHPRAGTFLVDGAADPGAGALRDALDRIPPALYDWLMWPGLRLLPPRLAVEYGIPDTAVRLAVSSWLEAGFRFWRPLFPPALRWMPYARRAFQRVEQGSGGQSLQLPNSHGEGVGHPVATQASRGDLS